MGNSPGALLKLANAGGDDCLRHVLVFIQAEEWKMALPLLNKAAAAWFRRETTMQLLCSCIAAQTGICLSTSFEDNCSRNTTTGTLICDI